MIILDKMIGETPLEALERFRASEVAAGKSELASVPMTYAGRLDPMAEGKLIILIGDECKEKEKYLNLDKEYEVEIVFGIETDTYDALGLVGSVKNTSKFDFKQIKQKYLGKFTQIYPPYSSHTSNGKQLHSLARRGELPEQMPTREVEIYSIDELEQRLINSTDLRDLILGRINMVKGDFRQSEIIKLWNEILCDPSQKFDVLKIRVKCSSGTYMRSLAHNIGKDLGIGAFALSINRTKIFFEGLA